MRKDKLRINEIFTSIQGESTYMGFPCTFIRLSGCNLSCKYCDTQYAVRDKGIERTIESVLKRVDSYGLAHVCVTGGEPLLQEGIPVFLNHLIQRGYKTFIETNGSLDISTLPARTCRIMDVKCPSSGCCGSTKISNLSLLNARDNLKFVIEERNDFEWALDFVLKYDLQHSVPLLLSPAALPSSPGKTYNSVDDILLKARTIAGWMIESRVPFRLQIQLHKLLWPARNRGI